MSDNEIVQPDQPLKSPRHELAVQYLALGDTAAEAYRKAGFSADNGNASRFFARPDVGARLHHLLVHHAAECAVTKETLTVEAEMHRVIALQMGELRAANEALMTKAKLHGLIQERHSVGGANGGPVEVVVGL